MTRLYAVFSSHALLPSPFRGSSLSARISEVRRRFSNNPHNFCCAQFLPPMRRTGAMPVAGSMPCAKGRMAHNLRLASWEPGTPASFDATPLGTYPQGRRLFLSYFLMALHFLKPMRDSRSYLRSAFNSLCIWNNTGVFLRMALRHTTCTRFSFQGTERSIAY